MSEAPGIPWGSCASGCSPKADESWRLKGIEVVRLIQIKGGRMILNAPFDI